MAAPTVPPFAELLRRYRRDRGLTQEALAELAGLSARGIRALEQGERTVPRADTVQLLAEALHLSASDQATFEAAARRPSGSDAAGQPHPLLPTGGFLGAQPGGPLIAREGELEQVLRVIEEVEGGTGRMLLLVGEAGVGKTRLAQEAAVQLRQRDFLVGTGRCYEPQQMMPLYPMQAAFSALHALAPRVLRIAAMDRWPYLRPLLPDELPSGVSLQGGDQHALFRAAAGFLHAVAESSSVAILLDDLHWSDTASLGLLLHLAREARSDRILMLGTYRDTEVSRKHPLTRVLLDLEREQLVERLAVRPLGETGTSALVAATLGEASVSSEFAELIHRRTEGNPFFVQQVVRMLVERGDVYRQDKHWVRRDIADIEVPEGIRALIDQRLTHLSNETQEVLHEASVLGQTFRFDDLHAMTQRPEDEVEAALEDAWSAGLVKTAGRDAYVFDHALTRQTLYAALSPRRKRRLHLAAGEALERLPAPRRDERVVELAWHFLEGDDPGRALTYTVLAGEQAERVYAHAEAEQQYRLALELARDEGSEFRESQILEKLGGTLKNLGRYNEALDVLERAVEEYRKAGNPEGVARLAARIGRIHADRGTCDEGIAYVQTALEAARTRDPSLGRAALYATLAYLFYASGRYREMQAAAERAAELARVVGDDEILANALQRYALALSMFGQDEEALSILHDVIPLAERIGDLSTLQRSLSIVADIHRVSGRFDQSIAHRERSLEVAHRLGDPAIVTHALATLGRVYFLRGNWEGAHLQLQRAASLAASIEPSWFAAYASVHFGELQLAQGARDEACQLLDAGVSIGQRNNDIQSVRMAQQALAELDLLQGAPEAARARLEPLLDRPGTQERFVTEMLPTLAAAYVAGGDLRQAEDTIQEAIRRATASNHNLSLAPALLVRGRLMAVRRDWTAAERDVAEVMRLARDMPYPHLEARGLSELGILHWTQGNLSRAREHLEEALAMFKRLGARPYVERTEETLAAVMGA